MEQESSTIFVTLYFDPELEGDIRGVWQHIADAGVLVAGQTGHRPHITLAAYDVLDVNRIAERCATFARTRESFPIQFHHLGIFVEKRVVFLAPRLTQPLFSLHDQLLTHFEYPGSPPLKYEPLQRDNWVPHCTLVPDVPLDQFCTVLSVCRQTWTPLSGRVEGIGLLVAPEVIDRAQWHFVGWRMPVPPSGT